MNPAVRLLEPRKFAQSFGYSGGSNHHSCLSSLCPHNAGVLCAEILNFGKFQQAFMQTQWSVVGEYSVNSNPQINIT